MAFLDNPSINWKAVVTSLLLGKYVFETYLDYRQYQVLHRNKPPKSLEKEILQETFVKARGYSQAKARFGFFSSAFDALKDVLTIKYDILPKLWTVAGSMSLELSHYKYVGRFFGASVMSQSLLFFAVTAVVSTLEGLPISYYQTFVLEEKFGFNKTTVKVWVSDAIKSLILTLSLGSIFMYAFLKIVDAYGPQFVSYACALVLVAQLFFMTIAPSLILPLFYKFSPLKDGELKAEIEALAARNKFPLSKLSVIDGSTRSAHSNAFFVGLPWSKKIVLYDTLVEHNTTPETVAVLAHEIGHWKLNHLTQLLVATQASVASSFVLFSAFLENKSLFHSFGFGFDSVYPPIIAFTLFSFASSPLNCLTQFNMNLLSRKNEYQADQFAADQGYSKDLARSLIKLTTENLGTIDSDWFYSAYNHLHPILADRLSALDYVSSEQVGDLKVSAVEKEE